MKIFQNKGFVPDSNRPHQKINFVDSNDVIVGFNIETDCCEQSGFYITPEISETIAFEKDEEIPNCDGYIFDINFFKEINCGKCGDNFENMVIFRLIKNNSHDLYLHLFNYHNGYYYHGFYLEIDGKIVKSFGI